MLLPVRPQVLDRVPFESVAGKILQPQTSSLLLYELPYRTATVTGQPVPNNQQLAGNVAQQMGEELEDLRATDPADTEPGKEVRKLGTTVAELERLKLWLRSEGCTHAVMESTGAYWKPVFNVLEETVIVILANAQQVKARKRHKTDCKDCVCLAHLLGHAMIRLNFIPPREIQGLRELTRRRKQLLKACTAERNRLQKVSEEANVKIGSVLSDVFGMTGQAILEALLEGKTSAEEMAQLARGLAKRKIPQLVAALKGHRLSDAHRFLIEHCLQHMAFLEQAIEQLEARILQEINQANLTHPCELLQTCPPSNRRQLRPYWPKSVPRWNPFPHPDNWLRGLVFVLATTRAPTRAWARTAPKETGGSERP